MSKASAAHHQADLAQQSGDLARAIGVLTAVIQGPRPGDGPEIAEVLADTRARLANLRSETGDYPNALEDVDEGLKLETSPTHFRGHLFEVQGLVLEREAKSLEAKGDTSNAARMRSKAMDAFASAVQIQDAVISEALRDAGR